MAATAVVLMPTLLACGDKFLVPNRGTRFQRAPGERPHAAILVYSRPASGLAKALANVDVERALRTIGYQPHEVATAADFSRAIGQGGWDVVLVSAADAASARTQVTGGAPPAILPVLDNPTATDLAAARAAYGVVIKAPIKHQAFLDVLDRVVETRADSIRKAAKPRG
jgi:hypothetical protein